MRDISFQGPDKFLWNPYSEAPLADPSVLNGVTCAVHLSGENLARGRWTAHEKRVIRASRIQPTHALARLLAGLRPKPRVLVCASAVGIYGDRGEEILCASSKPGTGFLADLCREWEEAAKPARDAGIRVVHLRLGVVLSPRAGALARILPVFRMGMGGALGSGKQWMSWVALSDAVRTIQFALASEGLAGPLNAVAPHPVTNAEFSRTLGRVLQRPVWLTVPAAALKLAFGEMAEATILASQRAIPEGLYEAGFHFEYPELEAGLRVALCGAH